MNARVIYTCLHYVQRKLCRATLIYSLRQQLGLRIAKYR